MSVLDNLTAQVASTVALEQSAALLISGIAAQLQAALNANDTAALQNLTQELANGAAALSAAVVANTPAANTPAPGAPTANVTPVANTVDTANTAV